MARGRRRRVWDHPIRAGVVIAAVAAASAWGNTDLHAPPRFDGAGYAVLAGALASGRGYREIDRPDAPRHAHFPPGYPAALAALWRATGGPSSATAHGFSLFCTVAATLAAWRWFVAMYGPRVAGRLGLALAANWAWNRAGGSIQSEPLFLLLGSLALLAASRASRRGGVAAGVGLGALLGACVLTRHVGVALAAAVAVDLALKRRRAVALAAVLTCAAVVLPWAAWLAGVRADTQVGRLGVGGLPGLVASQGLFYVRRLPDQLTGPVVEVGTVFQRRAWVAVGVSAWAAVATGVLVAGWLGALRSPRRRLAGLTALATLALLLVWPFTEAGRFLIPLVPCLLVGAVEGPATLARWFRLPRTGRARAAAAVLALSVPYSVYALATRRSEAQRRSHDDFDAACAWVAREGRSPGPVLTRHPGEVYWQTGRNALAPATEAEIPAAIDRWRVAYLLVDGERYAGAPADPLSGFARGHPGRVREVWARAPGRTSVRVYEVLSGPAPGTGGGRNPRNGGSSGGGAGPNW